MKYYVDPPSGWKYGFPKVFDLASGQTLVDFLKESGYPEKDLEFGAKYCRWWEYEEVE